MPDTTAAADLRARLVTELARHHRTLRIEADRTLCACGDWYEDINEHIADALAPLLADTRTAALTEGIDGLHQLWRLAPESRHAAGMNFAIGALMAVRDHPAKPAAGSGAAQ